MSDALERLYSVIESRREKAEEGSYTAYLFREGLDKILKKIGEECAETLIAAKNGEPKELTSEVSDLIYHVLVMMVNEGLPLQAVTDELDRRAEKSGNLKSFHKTDKNT